MKARIGVSRLLARLRERADPRAPRLSAPIPSVRTQPVAAPPPIFVVGCFRSGTSLLRRILDSHSRIACPPESKFVKPLLEVLDRQAAMRGLASMGFERPEVVAALAAFVSSFFRSYAAGEGKPRWADKTPDYVDCLDGLWELFGPAGRFVLIVRDGMDVAYSLADPFRTFHAIDRHVRDAAGDVPVGAARYWAEQNEKMEAFRIAHPNACIRIRYEDLTGDPETCMRAVLAFLGEPWEPAVLDFSSFPHHAGIEDPDIRRRPRIVPTSGKHRTWPAPVQEAVREACGPMLQTLGYR